MRAMTRIVFLLAFCSLLIPVNAQDYQAGSAREAFQIIGNDSIFPSKTIYENIKGSERFSIAAQIFELTDAQSEIDKLGMCTVFIPSNDAFSAYDEKGLEELLSSANAERLKSALMSHVIIGRVDSHSLLRNIAQNDGSAFFRSPADLGPEFVTERLSTFLQVPNAPRAKLTKMNFFHKSGYMHVVDAFLLPNEE